jgi:class 3 adenylate cyclase/tetratricopeptide (TPR) repeat protein
VAQPGSASSDSPNQAPGIRTFLIADVRGYTRFTVEHGDERAARLAARFAAVSRETVSARGGEVIELRGDEALAVFTSARDALRAAIELQARFAAETAADPTAPMTSGIGLDAGEAVPVEAGYRGGALNLAARLSSLAGPGEVLASEAVTHLARKVEGLRYGERGMAQLKGFADLVRVVEVTSAAAPLSSAESAEASARAIDQQLPIGGFLGALPAGPMVARREELRRVTSAVDAVIGGSGRFVLLAGEPGAGKTRIAQEATLEARDRGFVIAAGRCYEAEQTAPFYAVSEALAALHAACPPSLQAELSRRWPDVQRLLPNQSVPSPRASEGQEEQQRLFWAVTGFVQAIAEMAPVAVLLDDLHWADVSSLKLLLHLAHHTLRHRVLLLGTYRDVEVGRQHPLEGALVDLDREGLAERIGVRRLPEEDTAALMAASLGLEAVSEELAELVYRRTEGNPFFVQQVMRSLVERGDIYREDGRWQRRDVAEMEVPESIRSVIGQRLSRLSEPAQEALREASVLGQEFRFDDLLGMGERPEKELETALEEAAQGGLIRETGKDGYAFDHALTQQALYAELPARRLRRLHLAVAGVLEKLPERIRQPRVPEIAWHLVEGDAGARALPYCLLAGDQAEAVFAHSEAELQYRTALELARETGNAEAERRALEGLGQVLWALARHGESAEALEPLSEMYRLTGDADGEARAVSRIARAYQEGQRKGESIARATSVAERLVDQVSPGMAELYTVLAMLYLMDGRWPEGLAAAERAVRIAEAVGDDRLLAHAENAHGNGLWRMGRRDEALDAYIRARALAEAVGDAEMLGRAARNIGNQLALRGRHEEAQESYEQALETARRAGLPGRIAIAAVSLGSLLFDRGDWDEATQYYEEAAESSRSLGSARTFASGVRPAVMRLLRGGGESAVHELEEISAAAGRAGDLQSLAESERWLAKVDIWEGRPERGISRMEAICRMANMEAEYVEEGQWLLAFAYMDAGRIEPAAVIERARDTGGDSWYLAFSLWLRARLEGVQGHRHEAKVTWEEVLTLMPDLPYYRALILFDYGKMLVAAGEPDQARDKFAEALAIFQRLGARLHIPATERALADLS